MLHKFPEFAKITTNLTKGWFKNKGRKFIRHEHKHLSAGIYKTISSECPNSCSHGCQKCNFDIMEVFSYHCLVCMPTDVLRIICNNEVAFGFPINWVCVISTAWNNQMSNVIYIEQLLNHPNFACVCGAEIYRTYRRFEER